MVARWQVPALSLPAGTNSGAWNDTAFSVGGDGRSTRSAAEASPHIFHSELVPRRPLHCGTWTGPPGTFRSVSDRCPLWRGQRAQTVGPPGLWARLLGPGWQKHLLLFARDLCGGGV